MYLYYLQCPIIRNSLQISLHFKPLNIQTPSWEPPPPSLTFTSTPPKPQANPTCNWKRGPPLLEWEVKNFYTYLYLPWFHWSNFYRNELCGKQRECHISIVGTNDVCKLLFYGSLIASIKNKWGLKGSLNLLTLNGDFFPFKFSWRNMKCYRIMTLDFSMIFLSFF